MKMTKTILSLFILGLMFSCSNNEQTYEIETIEETEKTPSDESIEDTTKVNPENLTQPAATADDGGSKSIESEIE